MEASMEHRELERASVAEILEAMRIISEKISTSGTRYLPELHVSFNALVRLLLQRGG